MNPDQARLIIGVKIADDWNRQLLEAGKALNDRGNETAVAMSLIAHSCMRTAAQDLAKNVNDVEAARASIRRADWKLPSHDSLFGGAYRPGTETIFQTSRKAMGEIGRFLDEYTAEKALA